MRFLSERSIELHKEYQNDLILRYSIFEKSYPVLKGLRISEIYRSGIPYSEREAAVSLFSEISAHKAYFNSFSDKNQSSDRIKKEYGSIARFIYELSEACKSCKYGFLFVFEDGGRIVFYCGDCYEKILMRKSPLLALDLCEHAYFYDYGFKREDYVFSAISHFDLSKLEKSDN